MRLSTGLRHIEDTIALVGVRTARRVKTYAHDVKVEYRARQLLALQKGLRKQLDAYQSMSPAKKAAHIVEQMEVERRLAELVSAREQPITND